MWHPLDGFGLQAYKAMIKYYNSVVAHMEEAAHRNTEEGPKCKCDLKNLNRKKFLDAIHFLIDMLGTHMRGESKQYKDRSSGSD